MCVCSNSWQLLLLSTNTLSLLIEDVTENNFTCPTALSRFYQLNSLSIECLLAATERIFLVFIYFCISFVGLSLHHKTRELINQLRCVAGYTYQLSIVCVCLSVRFGSIPFNAIQFELNLLLCSLALSLSV